MRMWLVDPALLCRKHLLGEHVEMHMFAGHLHAGRALGGYAHLCEVDKIASRHDALAAEITARGMKHQSPLQHFEYHGAVNGRVDIAESLRALRMRCEECAHRIEAWERSGGRR